MKKRKRIGCITCVIWLILYLCACSQSSDIYLEEYESYISETEQLVMQESSEEVQHKEKELCYVYICGAVAKPGVYALQEGSRIYEVVEMAGGLSEDADAMSVNQAEQVTDGMMIRIYTLSERADIDAVKEDEADGRIDINTAGLSELMSLPGIGSAKAEAILSYRKENGPFSGVEELMNVPGIKEGIFQQMQEHIKVNK